MKIYNILGERERVRHKVEGATRPFRHVMMKLAQARQHEKMRFWEGGFRRMIGFEPEAKTNAFGELWSSSDLEEMKWVRTTEANLALHFFIAIEYMG